ncbi:MAG: hypothetical protein V4489_10025 [Chlamydiota bacterium]
MQKYITVLLVFLCTLSNSHADWNWSFDEMSGRLVSCLPDGDVEKYMDDYTCFLGLRERCLQNASLQKQIAKMKASAKELILCSKEGVILKKRRNNHIHELFAWEISTLLGVDSCIVPSFPIEIGGKVVIMQKLESFAIGEERTNIPAKSILKNVSLDNYWKAHFQAYLLGIKDLLGRNIGVNDAGEIRLFDMEACFRYQNRPEKSKGVFHTGFFMQSLGWPHYRQPLDAEAVFSLQQFIAALDRLEENIKLYLMYRPVSLNMKCLLYRLGKIRSFSLQEGRTFCDFYSFLFPRVSSGLDLLSQIVSKALKKQVDHADALLFIQKSYDNKKIPDQSVKEIKKWIDRYVD